MWEQEEKHFGNIWECNQRSGGGAEIGKSVEAGKGAGIESLRTCLPMPQFRTSPLKYSFHATRNSQLLEKRKLTFILTHLGITSVCLFKGISNKPIYIMIHYEILDSCQENWSHPSSQTITSPSQHLCTTNTLQQHLLMKSDNYDEEGWHDGLWIQRKLNVSVGPPLLVC